MKKQKFGSPTWISYALFIPLSVLVVFVYKGRNMNMEHPYVWLFISVLVGYLIARFIFVPILKRDTYIIFEKDYIYLPAQSDIQQPDIKINMDNIKFVAIESLGSLKKFANKDVNEHLTQKIRTYAEEINNILVSSTQYKPVVYHEIIKDPASGVGGTALALASIRVLKKGIVVTNEDEVYSFPAEMSAKDTRTVAQLFRQSKIKVCGSVDQKTFIEKYVLLSSLLIMIILGILAMSFYDIFVS